MNSRYKISYYLRIVLMIAIYVIFFIYIIYSCLHAENSSVILFNIIIAVIFGGLGTLAEYLRVSYDAATKRLIADGRPQATLDLLNRVEKADLFKSVRKIYICAGTSVPMMS